MKLSVIACVISVALLTACGPKQLTPDEKSQIALLKNELSHTDSQLNATQSEVNSYTGGMLKYLAESNLAILKTNKALIEQRINAIESGAKINVEVSGTKADPVKANSIQKDIDNLKTQIKDSKNDAAQYSGGLVLSMKLMAIATQEQTLAMLQQRYLSAKYGLPEFRSPTLSSVPVQKDSPASQPKPARVNENSLPPADGPFGLQEGLTLKNIEDMTGNNLTPVEGSVNLYTIKTVPKPDSDFDGYGLLISPTVGLCQIRALGKTMPSDSYGLNIIQKFEDLDQILTSKYGAGKKTDYLLPGSIWKEPQDWMMSLNKQERFLMKNWKDTEQPAMKNNNLTEIGIQARAVDSSSGYIYLEYDFKNTPACLAELENKKKSSL